MTYLSHDTVKIRKPRHCWGCAELFPVGSEMEKVNFVDGKPYSVYWCPVCDSYIKDHMESGDEFSFGEFRGEEHYIEYKNRFNELRKQKGL